VLFRSYHYYEFPQPIGDRLTDETWKNEVYSPQGPAEDRLPVTPPPVGPSDAPTTLAAQPSARGPGPAPTALPTPEPHAVSGRVLGPGGVPVAASIHVVPRDIPSSTEGPATTVPAPTDKTRKTPAPARPKDERIPPPPLPGGGAGT
jgi:hypothetical protein